MCISTSDTTKAYAGARGTRVTCFTSWLPRNAEEHDASDVLARWLGSRGAQLSQLPGDRKACGGTALIRCRFG